MSKTVFITGGASGIGAAAVTKFRNEGWNVLFTDIQEPSCKPEGTRFVKADSRNKAELEHAASVAEKEFGGIDALFCNSGIHRCNTVLDVSQEELDLMIHTNIYGTCYSTTGRKVNLVENRQIHKGGIKPHNGHEYKEAQRYEVKSDGTYESTISWVD